MRLMEIVIAAGAAVLLVALIAAVAELRRRRCPRCGKLFSGRVTGRSEVAQATTSEWGWDENRGEHRTIRKDHRGHLIRRWCRSCDHTWERLESTTRQLDRLTEAEAEEYRKRKEWWS